MLRMNLRIMRVTFQEKIAAYPIVETDVEITPNQASDF